ncbi:ABC transporter ATP-binding protein [Algihabitans albus]|uniref:ABC transporter ATP-binding protein n=1 Tax=Algihabitans albus TaxID=2164067 RepID=UPI000E5D18C6|nr:ABC transporter ATP-binding protein [Algihabitans albus]
MTEPLLRTNGLRKAFGAVQACDGIELEVQRGELRAIIGPNGAGKTSLISLLAGELKPDAGVIVFDGAEVTALPASARAQAGLARSYQITSLFPRFTALQNVLLAVQAGAGHAFRFWRPATQERALVEPAEAALARVGLGARGDVPAGALAHGEQRQLEIALALATGPKLLLLDEPTAGMSREETQAMVALLEGLKRDITIVLIEHDMDAVFALADSITVLVYGRPIATAAPEAIRNDAAVRAAYLGEQESV